ncbi:hypothetical protein BKA69DRAFT_63250 [Paraphysoderma sedebokerense]|nr:hypothetical protein BKA69DRAFT_63250 [Paraphysoderma sedebokerense]
MLHSDNHDQTSSSKNYVNHHYYSLSTVPLPQPPHPSNSSQSVVNIPAPKSDFHRPLDDNLNSFIPFGSVFDLDDSSCIHFRTQSHNTELVLQRIYKYTSASSSSSDRSLLNTVPTTIQKILKFEHAILPDIHFFQDSRNLNHIVCTLISANGVAYRFNWFKNESLFESMTATNVLNMVQCFPLVGRFNHLMVPLSCYSPHPDAILIPCSDGTIVKCSLPFYNNLEYSAGLL